MSDYDPHPRTPAAHPGYYHGPPPRGASITSLVLGLVSLLAGFTLVVPIVGFIFGVIGYRREPAGHGMAIAGLVINGIMLVGWVLLLIFAIGVLGFLGLATTSGSMA